MFTSIVFTAVLASSAALLSQAQVSPNAPGPGDSFNQGTPCTLGWTADDSGTNAWKSMSIELMTGSNEAMTHITTVATGQDGTINGTFSYTCPEVTPNSPIYFYQFTSCATTVVQWTGRFTIAGADGSSTPAAQTEQFNGQPVAFGTGALTDPSTAVAAPTCSGSSVASGASGASSGSAQTLAATTPSASPSLTRSTTPSSTPSGKTNASGSTSGSGVSGAAQASGTSAALAVGPLAVDTRMWPVLAALSASAMAFTILL